MKRRYNIKSILLIAIIIVVLSFYEVSILASIGMLAVLFVANRFLNELGNSIPMLELILLISGFQWIVGPFMLYRIDAGLTFLPEPEYMLVTVIAYICFVIGCLAFRKNKALLDREKVQQLMSRPKTIAIVKSIYWLGIVLFIVSLFVSNSLNQIFNIFYSFGFLASIMLLYSNLRNRRIYAILIYMLLFLKGVYLAVFAEFIAQGFLLIIFIPNIYAFDKKKILIFLGSGLLFLSILNTAKVLYRQQVWGGRGNEVNFELFFSVLFSSDSNSEVEDNTFLSRISSGMVNAMIINYVPSRTPHTNGEVLIDDFANALIPRVLYADKKEIDTRKNFMLYTGNYLDENTSVGVNALGIGYAEFGVYGCYLFMLIYGLFLSLVFNFFVSASKKNILYLFSILIAFLSVSKAETEFVGSVNGFIKAILFIIIFIFFISKNSPRAFVYEK